MMILKMIIYKILYMAKELLKTIGFTANQFSISNEILDLLEILSKDNAYYLSLLPREIFNIVIDNSRITPKQLFKIADNYHYGYILIKSENFVIILYFYEKSRNYFCGNEILDCSYFIIEYSGSIKYDYLYITVSDNTNINLYFYDTYEENTDELNIKYDESEIYFIELINKDLLKDATKLLNSIILRELLHYNYIFILTFFRINQIYSLTNRNDLQI